MLALATRSKLRVHSSSYHPCCTVGRQGVRRFHSNRPPRRSSNLRHQAPSSALLRCKVAIVGERHAGALPAQRIHDPGQILPDRKQILVEPHPRRVGADALDQSRQIIRRKIAQRATIKCPLNNATPNRADRTRVQCCGTDIIFHPRRDSSPRKRLAKIPCLAT